METIANAVEVHQQTFRSELEALLGPHESKEGRLGEAALRLHHSLARILSSSCATPRDKELLRV